MISCDLTAESLQCVLRKRLAAGTLSSELRFRHGEGTKTSCERSNSLCQIVQHFHGKVKITQAGSVSQKTVEARG